MTAFLLLTALLSASPARAAAPSPEDAALEQLRSEDYNARERACADLARQPKHGTSVYPALLRVMDRDISEHVRLAAAKAVLTFPGDDALTHAKKFLQSEPGEQIRGDMIVALSTEPSRLGDAGATDMVTQALIEDPAPAVRLEAAHALARRGDTRAIPQVRKASENDADKAVRAAARETLRVLTTPRLLPKAARQRLEPKAGAVKGKDPCPEPWGWCECDGPIKRPPQCLTKPDCRIEINTMIQLGMPCEWNGASIGAPGD